MPSQSEKEQLHDKRRSGCCALEKNTYNEFPDVVPRVDGLEPGLIQGQQVIGPVARDDLLLVDDVEAQLRSAGDRNKKERCVCRDQQLIGTSGMAKGAFLRQLTC